MIINANIEQIIIMLGQNGNIMALAIPIAVTGMLMNELTILKGAC